mgnify:CR=1 FL=1
MQVFLDSHLAKLEATSKLERVYGPETANVIRRRLQQLHDAESMEDLKNVDGHWEQLRYQRKHQISSRLKGKMRLLVTPRGEPHEWVENNSLVWSKIVAVEVVVSEHYK